MNLIANILVGIVAALHAYFLVLEMFFWTKPLGLNTFRMTLEKALAYIGDDELVEVTPKSIRLRKAILDPNDRKKAERAAKDNAA